MVNRLAGETSPYLRQHRDNPVDWYPWGDEAFEAARTRDVPILLSVGYSACHWCHVMAHESFEDPAVAAVMNARFVNVKVDREERPDVDAIYMEAVQAMSGSGGWPMTVFITADGRPFFGGTYFPPKSTQGRPGFVDLLEAVDEAWRNRRDELLAQADDLAGTIRERVAVGISEEAGPEFDLGPELLDRAYRTLRSQFDPERGGFGRAPKFPQPAMVEFVLRAHNHNQSPGSLEVVTTTLDAMASGGIYDHLGGGFARYSVDPYWLVPHFEKMLYDNAQLVRLYTHGWQVTGEARYRQVVEETIEYVLRDLRSPAGGLYSAEDADSEGVEGKFYVWSYDEVASVGGQVAIDWYGVTQEGNFEGDNILFRPERGNLIRPGDVEAARAALFERRLARVRPGLDDKVLTEWNAMFVAAAAEAGAAMGRSDWIEAAEKTAGFLLSSLRRPSDGRWLRSWQADSEPRVLAYAVDYAWLVEAFTRLAEATGSASWITAARKTADGMLELFGDPVGGGFFTTGHDAEKLLVRSKEVFDGATPSANSVAAVALARLGVLTGSQRYADAASGVLRMVLPTLSQHPTAFTYLLAAADLTVTGATEVVITGDRRDLVAAVASRFLPNAVLAWGERYDSPLWEGRPDEVDAAYVCRDYACLAPVTSVEDLLAEL
jgi:uncharacterized protein